MSGEPHSMFSVDAARRFLRLLTLCVFEFVIVPSCGYSWALAFKALRLDLYFVRMPGMGAGADR